MKDLWTKSTCAYCGVGCGIEAKVNAAGELEVRGDKDHPANYGELCSKGRALGETVSHEGRLLTPSIDGNETNWDVALEHVATQFSQTIDEFGADSVAFYVSGQLLTEDYYLANKLMKGFIGSGNIDTNSRLCMSSSVVGHKRAFGTDTVPVCYEDIEKAEMVVITGSNMAWCHPVLFQRLKTAKMNNPNLFIVVIDPRKTQTCHIADLHLAIQPGSDVLLFNALLSYLEQSNSLDTDYINQHTQGFEQALKMAHEDDLDFASLTSKLDVKKSDLVTFFKRFSETSKVVTIYSQGVNQSAQGSDKVNSIINCHLATGKIGREGAGPFSITGQPNAMGGREVGGLANMLAGHMEFGNESDHKAISQFWGTGNLATKAGLKAVDLFDAVESGQIKAIWIMATNPVVSMPNSQKIINALQKCPLVVVSDCMKETATTEYANVLLPAQGWSEKSGTVTNSERRISRQRRLLPTPGLGKPDWWIIAQVANKMGFKKAFDYQNEAQVFIEHAKLTTLNNESDERDLNLIGLTQLDAQGYGSLTPQQWPVLTYQNSIVHQRMFTDNTFFTASKKAQFIGTKHQQNTALTCNVYSHVLNTGRIRDHWHTMTRTGLSSRLSAHINEPFICISTRDALKKELVDNDIARIENKKGFLLMRVQINDDVKSGQLFAPIHWNIMTASKSSVCSLIAGNTDPISGQPDLKSTPVMFSKWHYKSEAYILSRQAIDLKQFDYWTKQTVEGGFLYRICDTVQPSELKDKLNAYIPKQSSKVLTTNSDVQNTYRISIIKDNEVHFSYIISKKLSSLALSWMESLLEHHLDQNIESTLFTGITSGRLAQGKVICACKQVGINTIKNAICEGRLNSVEAISNITQAGTGCGSCIPELSDILDACTEVA